MQTLDELFKADGTAHDPKTGQFTSGSGTKYTVGAKKKQGDAGWSTQAVHHAATGKHVGSIATTDYGEHATASLPPKNHGPNGEPGGVTHSFIPAKPGGKRNFPDAHAALHGLTHYHEHGKVGDFSSKAGTKRTLAAVKNKNVDKGITIGELFKRREFGAPATLASLLSKADDAPTDAASVDMDGSFEQMLQRVSGPACEGSGCENKPPAIHDAFVEMAPPSPTVETLRPHYQSVLATFPDHAYVRCMDEDKIWKVPYLQNDDGTITTGKPEEYLAVFKPAGDVDDEEDVADGGG